MGKKAGRRHSLFSRIRPGFSENQREDQTSKYGQGPILVLDEATNQPPADREPSLLHPDTKEQYRFQADKKYFSICIYALGTVAAAACIIYVLLHMPDILNVIANLVRVVSTFTAGFFIAFILNPLIKKVDKHIFLRLFHLNSAKARIMLSLVTVYAAAISFIILGFSYVLPQLAASVSDLIRKQEYLYEESLAFIDSLSERFQIDSKIIEDQLKSIWPQLVDRGTNLVMQVFPRLLNLGISIFRIVINILLSIAISIYALYDKRKLSKMMTRFVYAVFPIRNASSLIGTVKECGSIFSSFIIGKSIDSLIIGILCFFAMSAIGLPYRMLISVIVGITNMIPYFGPFIGAIPGIFLFLCINPVHAVVFAIMILILQQFDGWILGPWILGESTGISPLWVIFSITVGGAYAGVVGMFLGVPVFAVVSYLMNRFIDGKLKKKKVLIQ